MKDINYPLRKAYVSTLTGIVYNSIAVPVFYQLVPDAVGEATETLYIVIESISNNNDGTIHTQDLSSIVTLTIHSHGNKYNNGQAVDDVAGQIMELLLSDTVTVMDLSADNLQMTGIKLESDNVNAFTSQGNRIYIDRILRISQKIYLK